MGSEGVTPQCMCEWCGLHSCVCACKLKVHIFQRYNIDNTLKSEVWNIA
jgi:hypothetical protein